MPSALRRCLPRVRPIRGARLDGCSPGGDQWSVGGLVWSPGPTPFAPVRDPGKGPWIPRTQSWPRRQDAPTAQALVLAPRDLPASPDLQGTPILLVMPVSWAPALIIEIDAVTFGQNLGGMLNQVQYRHDSIVNNKDGKPVPPLSTRGCSPASAASRRDLTHWRRPSKRASPAPRKPRAWRRSKLPYAKPAAPPLVAETHGDAARGARHPCPAVRHRLPGQGAGQDPRGEASLTSADLWAKHAGL
jgi:hypothetical protein